MNVGAFGSHTFGACSNWVRVPEDFEFSEEMNVEMQARSGKKPAMYVKGQGEMNIPMKVHLDARLLKTDLATEVSWWLKVMRKQSKARLYLFGHYWGTKYFKVTKVHQSNTHVVGGKQLSCDLELQFIEWVANGSAETSSNSVSSSASSSASTTASTSFSSSTARKYSTSSSITKKAKSVKSTQKTSKTSTSTKTSKSSSSKKKTKKKIKVSVKAATKDSGKLSIKVVEKNGGGWGYKSLKPGAIVSIKKKATITVTWNKKKTYWVQILTSSGKTVLKSGNKGKLGPMTANQSLIVKACWR